jgi:hypothetical protein
MTRRPRARGLWGPAAPVLERLLAARGLAPGEWWLFLVQEEGKPLPGGLEALSGYVLTRAGDVYGWWLDWDPDLRPSGERSPGAGRARPGEDPGAAPGEEEGDYVFDRWWRVAAPERAFAGDGEYRRARERLGLA